MKTIPLRLQATALTAFLLWPLLPALNAQNVTAISSGTWSDPATWGGTMPTGSSNVFIGAKGRSQSLNASISLETGMDATVSRVLLGRDEKSAGTLILNGGTLTATDRGTGIIVGDKAYGALNLASGSVSAARVTLGRQDGSQGNTAIRGGALETEALYVGGDNATGSGTTSGELLITDGVLQVINGHGLIRIAHARNAESSSSGSIRQSGGIVRVGRLEVQSANEGNGSYTLSGGELQVNSALAGGGKGTRSFTWEGGTIRPYDGKFTFANSLGAIQINESGSGAILNTDSAKTGKATTIEMLAAGFRGNGALTINGKGVFDSYANNAGYSGTTTVRSGTLLLKRRESTMGSGQLIVEANGTLSGFGTINAEATVSGTLAPGFDKAIGTLNLNSNLTLENGATLRIMLKDSGAAGTGYGSVQARGTIRFPATGKVTLVLKGLDGHNVEGGDTFQVLSGTIQNVDASRIDIDNQTNWSGNWNVTANASGITVTATETPIGSATTPQTHAPSSTVTAAAVAVPAPANTATGSTASQSSGLRVLFIGDSIAGSGRESYVGYARHIEASHPDWEIRVVSATTSANLLARLQKDLASYKDYDALYINIGLHSIREDRIEDIAQFEENLEQAADLLATIKGPKVIWRTTTPISEGASGGRDHAQVAIYNNVAKRIMLERDIPVDDLYEYLMPYYNEDNSRGGKYIVSDGTHWKTSAQREIIAPRVVESITSLQ